MWVTPGRFHPAPQHGLPTPDASPCPELHIAPSRGCTRPPWLLGWAGREPAKQAQQVRDVGCEEGGAIFLPWILSHPSMRRGCKGGVIM